MNGFECCPGVSVLVCTLNEAENLPYFLPRIPDWVDEVLLVDGHSTDGTIEVAREIRPDIKVLYQPGRGKGDALRHGIEHASGDIIVTIDADGSMNPEEITRFVEPLLNGIDFSKGSRFIDGGGTSDMQRHRIFGNRLFTILTNMLHGTAYTDLAYGYNAFKTSVIRKLPLCADGFEIETEMNIKVKKAGLKIKEVPSIEDKRSNGTGKLRSFRDGWRILKTIFRERLSR